MVDVSAKSETKRTAIARAVVELNAHTLELLRAQALPKGDVLTVAQVAGIMAAKRTADLIPMCHPLALTHADVRFKVVDEPPSVVLEASASTSDRTGVEMEAIIAAQTAAATIYDMVKAVQKDVVIRDVRLILKTGGKSGLFKVDAPLLFDVEDTLFLHLFPCPSPGTGKGWPWPALPFPTKDMPGKGWTKAAPCCSVSLRRSNPRAVSSSFCPMIPAPCAA